MHKVFISGSISIKTLDPRVVERLLNVINLDYQVLVGDADGVDSAVQKHLLSERTSNVVVYCAGEQPRNNFGNWTTQKVETSAKPGTRAFFTAKDLEMAEVCDYGFMIWDTKSSGTLKNIIELLKRKKSSLVYINKNKSFSTIKSIDDFEGLLRNMSDAALKKAEENLKLNTHIHQLKNVQSSLF